MNELRNWLDNRIGYRDFVNEMVCPNIPGGARWRYVWGTTLVFAFLVQMVTGLFLWANYSPNALGAWESVYFIQYEMQGGWLLRGIHHYMASAMIVLLALHFLQVVIDGAYRAPREFNFWTGLVLMKIVLALSLTGYLLPWDQRGYRATQVSTNLMSLVPIVGGNVQRVVVGGPDYGHATLTRFFALHAGILPWCLIAFLVLHVYLFRRQGGKRVQVEDKPMGRYFPDQFLRDSVACLAVLSVVMAFVLKGLFFAPHDAVPGLPIQAHLGAELGAPADASQGFNAARPEWYFLFLFQLLKFFPGEQEIYGAIVIPGIIMTALFLMPIVGRWEIGHRFNLTLLVALMLGVGFLTSLAVYNDWVDEEFQQAKIEARDMANRAVLLAQGPDGIPEGGAVAVMRRDAKTQGPLLFAQHCASCHSYQPVDGLLTYDEQRGQGLKPPESMSAPNLYKFGTSEWIAAFLNPKPKMIPVLPAEGQDAVDFPNADQDAPLEEVELVNVQGPHFFGGSAHVEGEMADYIISTMGDEEEWTQEEIDAVVAALANESGLESVEQLGADKIAAGTKLLQDEDRCAGCHKFNAENDFAYAPDLSGYGSKAWLTEFISNPEAGRFYGSSNDRMPAFYDDPHSPRENRLTLDQLTLIVDWLRADWYEPEPTPTVQGLAAVRMLLSGEAPQVESELTTVEQVNADETDPSQASEPATQDEENNSDTGEKEGEPGNGVGDSE